jgi:hypothetical protein
MSGNWTESDYESGGQGFESLRARHYLAAAYRAKIIGYLRVLQGRPRPRPMLPSLPESLILN